MSRAGGERPFRSARPFPAWQDRPLGHGLTMTASVGVRLSPVSRLFNGGVRRSLIAYSSPTPLSSANGIGLGAILITRLTGSRRSKRPFAAGVIAGTLALEACVARQQPPTRGMPADTQIASGGYGAAPATSTRTAIGKPQ